MILVKSVGKVQMETEYRLRFRIKSDQNRTFTLTMADERPPFKNLGLFEVKQVNSEWTNIEHSIRPNSNCDHAIVTVVLGDSSSAVEISPLQFGNAE